TAWPETGVPSRPGAWLTTVARRRALDELRRESVLRRSLPLLVDDGVTSSIEDELAAAEEIPDDRLRLICTCCHPALSRDAQVALTLKLVCGLTQVRSLEPFSWRSRRWPPGSLARRRRSRLRGSPIGCRRSTSCRRASMRC